jgi:hypothetical protein
LKVIKKFKRIISGIKDRCTAHVRPLTTLERVRAVSELVRTAAMLMEQGPWS